MNVNYNNLYCDYIGATGTYSISDYIDITSNTLAINSSNFISGTSNILNDKIYITSNTLNDKITNVDIKYNIINPYSSNSLIKIIVDEYSNSNVYINNPFNFGKIYFKTTNANNLYTRIDYDNKLYVYFPGSLLPPKFPEWWCVEEKLSSIFDVNTGQDTAITGLGLAINEVWDAVGIVEGQISQLQLFTLLDTANTRIALAINGFTLAQNILTGATAFTIAIAGYALGVALYINNNYVSTNLLNQITSNLEYTYEEKTNLTNEIIKDQYSNCLLISSNLSNLNVINGFINSNIQTQQYINSLNTIDFRIDNINISNIYVSSNVLSNLNINLGFINSNITTEQLIPSLKTSLLNLNSGNIINVNNIVSSGKIKENDIFLESKYATINYVNTNLFNNSYSPERLYPPKTFNSYTLAITSTEILGRNCFKETITLTSDNITYGSGTYNIYSSSSYGDYNFSVFNIFNFTTNTAGFFGSGNYNYNTGFFNRTDMFLKNNYFGDWVVIKLLSPLILNRFKLYYTNIYSAPALWRLYGSSDGLTFTEIPEGGNFIDALTINNYSGGFYEKIFDNTKEYLYIGIVINKIIGGNISASYLNFGQFQLYGVNVNNYNNVYTTSNAVKGIVEFDMPIVSKHYAFYINITTPIVINTKTYYKYDIDLRQYTKLGYIDIGSQSGDSYRIFKLRACYGSMYFSTLVNGLPNVVYSDIFMSMKANPTANLGAAGLNICSIGSINNPRLDIVPSNNLFFMRNGANSIDYITVVSTNIADVRCFIEDMIS
jgi:hypothetical protein